MLTKWLKVCVVLCCLCLLGFTLPGAVHAGTLENAVDNPVDTTGDALIFSLSGSASWAPDAVTPAYSGMDSLRSGQIGASAYSAVTTTVHGPASISFYQKISSQLTYDTLKFSVNGVVKSSISGTVNWKQSPIITLPTATTYTLTWKYAKNGTVTSGLDAAWIDKVVVSPNTALKVTSPNDKLNLYSGDTMTIAWNAPAAAEKYKISYTTNGGLSWISFQTGTNYYVPAPGFNGVAFTTTVPTPPTGNMANCKVRVQAYNNAGVLVGQDVSDNPFTITVLEVTSPNGGVPLSARNNPNSVAFHVYGPTTATSAVLSYTIDGGLTWPVIVTGLPITGPGDYTYNSWNIPAWPALKNAKVKVTLKNGAIVLGTDTSNSNFTITPVYTISGTVMQAGKPLSGATVGLSGAETLSTTTDSLGKYSFTKLLKGGYTVSVSKTGSIFTPASLAVAITTANMTAANFTGTLNSNPTYTLSGTVSGATGTGVVLTLSGTRSGTAMTDDSGNYFFPNLPEGNYNVTPGKAGYRFDPVSRGVALDADTTGIDFTSVAGTSGLYSISGRVTSGGLGLPGVTITASGAANATVVTNTLGNYTIKGLKNGSYTITPSAAGYVLTPLSRTKTIASLSLTGVNFSATAVTAARGTVAIGSPVTDSTVTLKDAKGVSRTAVTAGDGTYLIDTTGLTPPLLLLVTTATGTNLYSVSTGSGGDSVINITPLTDLIIRSWYDVQGVSMDSAFAAPGTNPPPTPTAVAVIGAVVKNMIELWLNQAGVNTNDFNLISTPFSADGTGVDAVLDQTTVDPAAGSILVSDGTTTQTSTVSVLNSSLTISTTTASPDGTTTTNSTTIVPVQTAQQTALDGITAAFGAFADMVNSKSTSTLTVNDVLPFLDPNGRWSGANRSQWAERIVYFFAGRTVSFSGIAIRSMNDTYTAADTVFNLSVSQGGQTSTEPQEFFFKKINGVWVMSGDNRIANVEVRANMVRSQGSWSSVGLNLEINVDCPRSSPTVTSLNGVTVTGGSWNATPLSYYGQSLNGTVISDMFGIYAMNPAVSGGTPFTFVLTPASGPTVTYTQTVNAITTEAISITNLTGGTIADAHLGAPQAVNWTLPKTFAVSHIQLGTVAYTGVPDQPTTVKCDDMGAQVVLGNASTTAQLTIPATCGGQATVQAEIYLLVSGVNGELTTVYYTYQ